MAVLTSTTADIRLDSTRAHLMDLTVTAIYRSPAVAHLVRDELGRAGIDQRHVTVLPGARIVSNSADASGSATTPGNIEDALRRLHDLHLSESASRTCRQALQNGGYVVSASLGDEAKLARVQEVMDRPGETFDLNEEGVFSMSAAVAPTVSCWAAMPASGS